MEVTMPLPPDKQELILYRLDQQDRDTAKNRTELKEALAVVAAESMANRLEVKDSFDKVFSVIGVTNGRVTGLERFKWAFGGALLVIVTVIGWVVSWGPHK